MLSFKKNFFSFKNNAILHNRVILYFIFLVSLGNLFYLSVERDFTSISIFLLVGFLTSFFSKNMLIVLFVALLTSAIIKHGAKLRHEGLENMVDDPDAEMPDTPANADAEVDAEADAAAAEEDNDLSNENYLEDEEPDVVAPKKTNTKKTTKKPTKTVEEDTTNDVAEEEVVENYEGEEDDIFEDAEDEYVDDVEPFSGWR